jgi:hypothetical protein
MPKRTPRLSNREAAEKVNWGRGNFHSILRWVLLELTEPHLRRGLSGDDDTDDFDVAVDSWRWLLCSLLCLRSNESATKGDKGYNGAFLRKNPPIF